MPRASEDIYLPITIRNTAMSEHISVFTQYHLKRYAKETVKTYTKALRSFLSFILDDRNFKFRIEDIERYKAYLEKKKELSPATITTYLTALRRFCQYLVECKELPRNPVKQIRGISNTKKLPMYYTHKELVELLNIGETQTVTDLRDISIMHLFLGCFLTETEIHTAQVKDFIEHGSLLLKHGESIYLPQSTIHLIQSYLKMRFGESIPQPDLPLFESNSNRTRGNRISVRGIRNAIHQRILKATISQERKTVLSAYSFRHTGGCLLAIAGMNDQQIMRRMRLKWKSTAMQYIHVKQEAIAAGLEQSVHLIE